MITWMALGVSIALLVLGMVGVLVNRKNFIALLMCVELMLLGVNFNFIAFSQMWHRVNGQVMVFFVLAVAAAESALGLAILVSLWRKVDSIALDAWRQLKE